jgi:hypothetical protein
MYKCLQHRAIFEVMFDIFNVNVIYIQTGYSQKKMVILITDDYELVNNNNNNNLQCM